MEEPGANPRPWITPVSTEEVSSSRKASRSLGLRCREVQGGAIQGWGRKSEKKP